MISEQWKQPVNNAHTYLRADCDTDHNLEMLTIKLRFRKKTGSKPLLLDLKKLNNEEFKQQYQLEVKNRFDVLQKLAEYHTPDELCKQLKDTIFEAANMTLPTTTKSQKRKNRISFQVSPLN